MSLILLSVLFLVLSYATLSLIFSYLVMQFPRRGIVDPPDWGKVTDTRIPTVGGGSLEVWRIEPEGDSRGCVVLAHGWGRNRDRMIKRARFFASLGFTTVVHSARDHGGSSRFRFMNALRFAEDVEAVLDWVAEPVLLYGHSAGSAGSILAANRRPESVRLLFLEASYADTEEALHSLYSWLNPVFGFLFAPAILFLFKNLYRYPLKDLSPARLAPGIDIPVMIIHGELDRRFPLAFAHKLRAAFKPGQTEFFVAPGSGHSDCSLTEGYTDAVQGFLRRRFEAVRVGVQD